MPCHVFHCTCGRFTADSTPMLCPVCSRGYAGRASLEIHVYAQHPGLTTRERSVLIRGAVYPLGGTSNAWEAEVRSPPMVDSGAEA
ncbi:MAG: hypothetical protein L3K15_05760 [Thermoplasmata archaeon]|nr:hypothetical protein [Thermoplasmata archaeon]